jgi:hypothetical protein
MKLFRFLEESSLQKLVNIFIDDESWFYLDNLRNSKCLYSEFSCQQESKGILKLGKLWFGSISRGPEATMWLCCLLMINWVETSLLVKF